MSFGHSTPGKDIWGTTTYKIHLIPVTNKFDEMFEGTLILYERRWEKKKGEFLGLSQFVTLLKDFWGDSLRHGNIQETRLARWIEEYLNQINIEVTYEAALQAVKGEAISVSVLDGIGERANKEIITDFLRDDKKVDPSEASKLTNISDGIVPKVVEVALSDKFNLDENADEFLSALIEKHKPDRATQIKSTTSFRDENGKIRTLEKKVQIESSPTTGNSKMGGGMTNTFGFAIQDVEIEDRIPFEFTVEDVTLSDDSIEKVGETLNEEGLFIKWKIPRIEPKQEVNIDYYLGNRITRTIVAHDEKKVSLINTYEPIVKQQDGLYADALFVNNSGSFLKTIKIVDQIPKELDLVSSTPIIDGSNVMLEAENVNEVHWRYESVPVNAEIQVHYDLKEKPFIRRDIYEITNIEGEPLLQATKVVKQLKHQFGFGVILAIRPLRVIEEDIVVRDTIPNDVEISSIMNEEGNVVIGMKGDTKVVEWNVTPGEKGKIIHAFLRYKPSNRFENTKLTVAIGDKESHPTGEISSTRTEQEVVLPYQYGKFVDVRA